MKSILRPSLESLKQRRDQLIELLAGPGRYEQRQLGGDVVILEKSDLKKKLKEVNAMIKAQEKSDKKFDPAFRERKQLRAQLMKLPKGSIVDLYLNLRYDEVMLQQFHMPVYKRGLEFEKSLMENGAQGAKQRFLNNVAKLKLDLTKANITLTTHSTVATLRRMVGESIQLPSDDKTLRRYINELKKGS